MTTDRRVFVCSNGDCKRIYGEDPQFCPYCKRNGLTWTTYPCDVVCAACGGTKQVLMRVQYTNRACADEMRRCPLCVPDSGPKHVDVQVTHAHNCSSRLDSANGGGFDCDCGASTRLAKP